MDICCVEVEPTKSRVNKRTLLLRRIYTDLIKSQIKSRSLPLEMKRRGGVPMAFPFPSK